jgi:CIC family chloride channel protein
MMRVLAGANDLGEWTIAADIMQPAITVTPNDDLRTAAERMLVHNVRELLVVDPDGKIVGFLDEADVARAYLSATGKLESPK